MEIYGKELILDIHGCNVSTFNRDSLDAYFEKLCKAIKMEKCERYFWDDIGVPEDEQQTSPHTKGTSAVQFILTSTLVVHTLEITRKVFVNVFSCKDFDSTVAAQITEHWFGGRIIQIKEVSRI